MRKALELALLCALAAAVVTVTAGATSRKVGDDRLMKKIDHIVVIYEENHSFDNLYGGWEGVNGRANATAAQITQLEPGGDAFHVPAAGRREPVVAAACGDL